ncbi:MAG: FeoB-associated Cys-rich membrane protein [Muribaculaceae bacterium]|nr:FeoB-associated Cys-rich membrane protein [Muribaculaceae bacterium]
MEETELMNNLMIQYILVGFILFMTMVWVVWKFLKLRKKENKGSCCNCSLSSACQQKR